MSKEKKPYNCSVCGTEWESASKRVPRHRCKGEFKGKVGTGIPAKGHPDYEEPKVEEGPIVGDVVFDTPDFDEEEVAPITKTEEEPEEVFVLREPEEKKEESDSSPAKGEVPVSKSITPALLQTVEALTSDKPLTKETATLLSAQLLDSAVELETTPVRAELTGAPLLIGIALLSTALYLRTTMSAAKKKVKGPDPTAEEEW